MAWCSLVQLRRRPVETVAQMADTRVVHAAGGCRDRCGVLGAGGHGANDCGRGEEGRCCACAWCKRAIHAARAPLALVVQQQVGSGPAAPRRLLPPLLTGRELRTTPLPCCPFRSRPRAYLPHRDPLLLPVHLQQASYGDTVLQ